MARGNDVQLGGITDLNLLADIKRGFVDALEVVTYVDRLRKVLRTLNGLRLGARESSAPVSPYTDIVARWRIVHSFRWSIVEGRDGAPDRLLLSVNFDGGWEPYMRVIWDQLGSTLDLMLCHTEGYQLSRECSFETYVRWVREHEVSADFLFIESGRTVSDAEYLARLEAAQRGRASELAFNRLRAPASGEVQPLPTDPKERFAMAARGLVPLAALFTLQRFFGATAPDRACLLRATHDILFELRELDTSRQFPKDGGKTPGGQLRQRHHEMLAWFEQSLPEPRPQARELSLKPGDLQCCILTKPPANRGALVMLRVAQPAQAVAWLSTAPVQRDNDASAPDGVWRQVALTLAGLKALGVPAARISARPARVVTWRKWTLQPAIRTSARSRAMAMLSASAGAWGRPSRVAISPEVATAVPDRPWSWLCTISGRSSIAQYCISRCITPVSTIQRRPVATARAPASCISAISAISAPARSRVAAARGCTQKSGLPE